MLAEHRFNLTEFVDQKSTARLGKMLGPAALVFVKVTRCVAKEEPLYQDRRRKNSVYRTYISRTTFDFKASIRTVDLATGRTFRGIAIDETLKEENSSTSGQPEFPSRFDLQDAVIRKGVVQAHRMFFPWTETRQLYFFDDEPCGLKAAFQLLKAGDQDGALRQSLANIEGCVAGPSQRKSRLARPVQCWHGAFRFG